MPRRLHACLRTQNACIGWEYPQKLACVTAQAREPLLRALHDLALCHALGWPKGVGAGMAHLHSQLRNEALDEALPPEGAVQAEKPQLAIAACTEGGIRRAVLVTCRSAICSRWRRFQQTAPFKL